MVPISVVTGVFISQLYFATTGAQDTDSGVNVGNNDLVCAWPIETTPEKTNVAYPDSNATYWTMPFFVESGLEITIKGRFPSARYFGIDVYGNDSLSFVRNDVPSTLPDFEIDPDANGTNPWQSDGAGSGDYTISVSNSVMSGQSNVLPLSPSPPPSADDSLIPILPANTGYLMFRVYLPENGDPNDTTYVELPTLTFSIGAVERELAPCSVAQSDAGDFSPSGPLGRLIQDQLSVNEGGPCDQDNSCPPLLSFSRAGGATTPFPNGISGYVAALYQPAPGYVSVVRAHMPSSSRAYGDTPAAWPQDGTDLRYWSFCNYLYQVPFPVIEVDDSSGCVADDAINLSGDVATVVMSSVADRPEATQAPDSTLAWLPTSPTYPAAKEVIAVRNMLAASSFDQSATSIRLYKKPALAKRVMGEFYPEMTQCTVETFSLFGADGCFANPSSPTPLFAGASVRLEDTRDGGGSRRLGGSTVEVVVGAEYANQSVAVNLTIARAVSNGYATLHRCDKEVFGTSSINYQPMEAVANVAITEVSSEGTVCVYLSQDAHVIVDLLGVFSVGGGFVSSGLVRLEDTRDGGGSRRLGGSTVEVVVGAEYANQSVAVNLTIARAVSNGYATLHRCDKEVFGTSSINYQPMEAVANVAITEVSSEGTVCVYLSQDAHVIVDLLGVFQLS